MLRPAVSMGWLAARCTAHRLSSTVSCDDLPPKYGVLDQLIGTWTGDKGYNVVMVPSAGSVPETVGGFKLIEFNYNETLEFTELPAARNRGGLQEQLNGVIKYSQQIVDTKGTPQHDETGMFLYLDNMCVQPSNDGGGSPDPVPTSPFVPQFQYARSGTIPHGNSIMLLGNATPNVSGPPDFSKVESKFPLTSPTMGQVRLGYEDVVIRLPRPLDVLQKALEGQEVVNTTTLSLETGDMGGILNTPFTGHFAKAARMNAIFWIETIKEGGKDVMQLQYAQMIELDFHFTSQEPKAVIHWPHLTVNTLRKQ